MSSKEKIKKEIELCIHEVQPIILYLKGENTDERFSFHLEYQKWYSKALKIIEFLSPDRLAEFKSFYEIDPKRKHVGFGTYVIQDYVRGTAPASYHLTNFNTKGQTLRNLYNQYSILNSVTDRIENAIADLQNTLYTELQDQELANAQKLTKINARAAGIIAGILLENHLFKLAKKHGLKPIKSKSTLSHLNILLKEQNIYDATTARKLSYLGDIRRICTHIKGKEPSMEQVDELISGVNWAIKNIY